MALFEKIRGTISSIFQLGIGATALQLKEVAGVLQLRNKADSAFVNASVGSLVLNDGGSNKLTLSVPTLAGDLALNFPTTAGSAGQVLQTNGSGTLSFVSAASTAACQTTDTTSLAFGTTSPLTLFTLPVNAVISDIRIVVDTPFNGTPTMSIGIAGTTSKYTGTGDCDLTAANEYQISPGLVADGTTNALIATYSAGGSSAGAARLLISYSVPQ